LVRQAATSDFTPDFDWISDKEALRVTCDAGNRGLTAIEIRELAKDWIKGGGTIDCVEEQRPVYRDRRHKHYDIIIIPLGGFPNGLYVYMELNTTGSEPAVALLNAHPPTMR
jgi:hypothetical protein